MLRLFFLKYGVQLLSLGLTLFPHSLQADTLIQQRWKFKEAQQFLLKEDLNHFENLITQLKHYPITHYLRYLYFKSHWGEQKPETMKTFLEDIQGTPLANQLRQEWLLYLAEKEQWETFLTFYVSQDHATLQCHYLHARIHLQLQLTEKEIKQAKELWLVGTSQARACDHVFDHLYEKKILNDQLHWQRIRMAMQNNDTTLAGYLAKHLPPSDQVWVNLWRNIHLYPERELKIFKQPDTPLVQEILLHGIKRMAREEVGRAYHFWEDYKKLYPFKSAESKEVFRYIALKSAEQDYPKAWQWLTEVDKDFVNDEVQSAQLKVALTKQNWSAIAILFKSLSPKQQKEAKWQYWQARALEQMGNIEEAETIFNVIYQKRGYYGFLAAERLGEPYQFGFHPVAVSRELEEKLLNDPRIIRTKELYFVGLTEFARAEWQALVATLTVEELTQVARLAHQWGWNYEAITALGKTPQGDDLNIRFPLPFYDIVLRYAPAYNLEMAWVYAVMRQESAFQVDARSNKGALGLMQLLPSTAQQVAEKYTISISGKLEDVLLLPEPNIRLGSAYLKSLLDELRGNYLLATVAYNAGPSRAKLWATHYSCLSPDIWVELIPFSETYEYVQRVMSYTLIFENQLRGNDKNDKLGPLPLHAIQEDNC